MFIRSVFVSYCFASTHYYFRMLLQSVRYIVNSSPEAAMGACIFIKMAMMKMGDGGDGGG